MSNLKDNHRVIILGLGAAAGAGRFLRENLYEDQHVAIFAVFAAAAKSAKFELSENDEDNYPVVNIDDQRIAKGAAFAPLYYRVLPAKIAKAAGVLDYTDVTITDDFSDAVVWPDAAQKTAGENVLKYAQVQLLDAESNISTWHKAAKKMCPANDDVFSPVGNYIMLDGSMEQKGQIVVPDAVDTTDLDANAAYTVGFVVEYCGPVVTGACSAFPAKVFKPQCAQAANCDCNATATQNALTATTANYWVLK